MVLLPIVGYLLEAIGTAILGVQRFQKIGNGPEPAASIRYSVIPFILLLVTYLVARFVYSKLRWRRINATDCSSCGYNLTGNVSGICPECGLRIQVKAP
jgi:hypothetical protein